TRTADELSVVCRQDAVPEGVTCERGWRCLRVAGAMSFSVVGVLASLTAPLRAVMPMSKHRQFTECLPACHHSRKTAKALSRRRVQAQRLLRPERPPLIA